jgi:hypothetical protein
VISILVSVIIQYVKAVARGLRWITKVATVKQWVPFTTMLVVRHAKVRAQGASRLRSLKIMGTCV